MAAATGPRLPKDLSHQHSTAQPHRQLRQKPAQHQRRAAQPQHPGERQQDRLEDKNNFTDVASEIHSEGFV